MSSEYILTENTRRCLEGKGYELRCARCGKPIQTGETVVSKIRSTSRKSYRIFHKDCLEQMFR